MKDSILLIIHKVTALIRDESSDQTIKNPEKTTRWKEHAKETK